MNSSKIIDIICIIFTINLAIMVIYMLYSGIQDMYAIVTGIIGTIGCTIPLLLKHKNLINIPIPLILAAEIAIFIHTYGVISSNYDMFAIWDIISHTTSSIIVALCVFYALLCINHFDKNMGITSATMHIYVFLITMTLSVYWEVFEIMVDIITGSNMQYGPWDTVRDLCCDIAGAAFIGAYAHYFMKRRNIQSFVEKINLHQSIKNYISHESKKI